MQEAFGIVLFVVVGVAAVAAVLSLVGRGRLYDEIGRSVLEPEREPAPAGDLAQEIRTLVEAGNARRARRGEPPLDVEAEVARQLRELGGA